MNHPLILSMHLNTSVANCRKLLESRAFIVMSEKEADKCAEWFISESLWTVKTSLILKYTNLPPEAHDLLRMYQKNRMEHGNDVIHGLLIDMRGLVKELIAKLGRGRFLRKAVKYEEIKVGDYLVYRAIF